MMAMKERFSSTELTALRNDLLQGGLIDSREAARDAVGRVEMSGCSLPVLEHELENLALVM